MSDLQCPARFLVLPSGTDSAAAALAGENVHAELTLHEPVEQQLLDLADLYRGETVAVHVDALPPGWPSAAGGCEVLIDSDGIRLAARG